MGVYQRLLPEFILILLGFYLIATNVIPHPSASADSKEDYRKPQQNPTYQTPGQGIAVPLVLLGKDKYRLANITVEGKQQLREKLFEVIKHGARVEPIEGSKELKKDFYRWYAEVFQDIQRKIAEEKSDNLPSQHQSGE